MYYFIRREVTFQQGKEIVHGPVDHQARRRIIQQHQKNQGHTIELQLVLQGQTPGIDGAGDQVDGGHEDRKHVYRYPRQGEKAVRRPQVGNRAEGGLPQGRHGGQEPVGGDEKRHLQQKGQGAPQGIEGLVAVLPVIGLQHHKPLVAGKCLFDMRHPRGELLLLGTLLVLDGVCPVVQGQQQHIHYQAHGQDGETHTVEKALGIGKYVFENQNQRSNEQLVQRMGNCHPYSPLQAQEF